MNDFAEEFHDLFKATAIETPFEQCVYHPFFRGTKCKGDFTLSAIVYSLLPGMLIDSIMKLNYAQLRSVFLEFSRKLAGFVFTNVYYFRVLPLYRNVIYFAKQISYFSSKNFTFENENTLRLVKS